MEPWPFTDVSAPIVMAFWPPALMFTPIAVELLLAAMVEEVPEFGPIAKAPLVCAWALLPMANAPLPLAEVVPLPMANVAPPVAGFSVMVAQTPSDIPSNAILNAVSLNKAFRRPCSTARTSSAAPPTVDEALTCPFANSEVTTKDWIVRFQTILKILFILFS